MLSLPRNIRKKDDENEIEKNLQNNYSQISMKDVLAKDVHYNKKKLNNDDISKNVETSSDESEIFQINCKSIGKNQNNLSPITLKFRRLPGQFMYKVIKHKIGITEKNVRNTRAKVNLNETQRKLRNVHRTNLNYNYDYLWDKQKDYKRKIYLESQNARKKSIKELLKGTDSEDIKVNTRKRSIRVLNKLKNLEKHDQESENEEIEVDENKMHNTNTNLSSKRLKTRSASKQIQIESNFRALSESSRRLLRNSIGTDTKLFKQLKISSENNTEVSIRTSTKSLSHLKPTSKSDLKSLKKSIHTPTKCLSQLTPSKSDIKPLKVSMSTPTRAFEELNLNESSRPITRMRINGIKPDSPLQNNRTPKRSTYKVLKDDSPRRIKISTRKRSTKFTLLFDGDTKTEEDKDNNVADENYEYNENSDWAEDEISGEGYEGETIYSENESWKEPFDSLKRQKFKKKALVTLTKTPKNNMKTLSMSLKKNSDFLTETPVKRLSRLSLKNFLSPSVHQRIINIAKPSTPLQEVRLKLHVSVLPKSLPCREEQFNDIYTYLHTRLSDGSSGCIYISGVPGTGKTATVNEVIRCLKKLMSGGKLTKFDFVNINGMKLSEPRQAYVQIWKQLAGKTVTWEAAHKLLQNRFTKSNSKQNMILLLVDELDLLCTKRQDVIYNLLDWPSKSGVKLVVVTIANTMDLPERILMGRVTSRLGLTRLTFPPYNHKQLEQIVLCRLKGYDTFSGETVQLIARKVAAVSGDARRALDICRRSTEVAETSGREMVSMIDVKKALDEMIASPKIQAIKHCSDMEKVFLKAMCAEVHRTGVEEVVFKNVYFQLQALCTIDGEKAPNVTEALSICARLGSWRLLLCDHSKMDIHQRLLLNATTDDIYFAIKSEP